MRIGIAVLRTIVGGLLVGHGLQKLAGWFGGRGLQATSETFESMGLRPGKPHALAAGVSETAGGAMLAAGLLTPVGASMVTGSMAVAVRKVHAKNGVWVTDGGFEYNLVLAAAAFAIAAEGPGAMSLDERLGLRVSGPMAAFAELAAALIGATVVVRRPQPQPEPVSAGVDMQPNGAEATAPTKAQAGAKAQARAPAATTTRLSTPALLRVDVH